MDRELFIDDNVVIPDKIKNMSREELEKEIARLEEEARKDRERMLHEEKEKTA